MNWWYVAVLEMKGASENGRVAGVVLCAAKKKAQNLLEQESRVTLTKRDFLAFSAAINGAFSPNPAVQNALKAASKVKRA